MNALIKACIVGNSVRNSGKECDIAMGPTAMIIAVPPSTIIEEDDLADIVAWAKPLIHADKQSRIYPFFGSNAPIVTITNDTEADVQVTLDNGVKVLVRRGVYNRIYETISGGLCYADFLFSLTQSGYSVIEIDQSGRTLLHKNSLNEDGEKTWGGLKCSFMAGLAPTLATFQDVYRNRFTYSFTPEEMVYFGEIFEGGMPLLDLMGLIDTEILPGDTPNTATEIFIKVASHCAESDLIALLGPTGDNPLEDPDAFVVNDVLTGALVPLTAVAVVGDELKLTGVFASGKSYTVAGGNPSVWYDLGVVGYDASANYLTVSIP